MNEADLLRANEALRAELEIERERCALLKSALGEELPIPMEWGLTKTEALIFGVLACRTLATRNMIAARLYVGRPGEWPDLKTIDVMLVNLRRKLKSSGVTIQTAWGRGWFLAADDRAHALSISSADGSRP